MAKVVAESSRRALVRGTSSQLSPERSKQKKTTAAGDGGRVTRVQTSLVRPQLPGGQIWGGPVGRGQFNRGRGSPRGMRGASGRDENGRESGDTGALRPSSSGESKTGSTDLAKSNNPGGDSAEVDVYAQLLEEQRQQVNGRSFKVIGGEVTGHDILRGIETGKRPAPLPDSPVLDGEKIKRASEVVAGKAIGVEDIKLNKLSTEVRVKADVMANWAEKLKLELPLAAVQREMDLLSKDPSHVVAVLNKRAFMMHRMDMKSGVLYQFRHADNEDHDYYQLETDLDGNPLAFHRVAEIDPRTDEVLTVNYRDGSFANDRRVTVDASKGEPIRYGEYFKGKGSGPGVWGKGDLPEVSWNSVNTDVLVPVESGGRRWLNERREVHPTGQTLAHADYVEVRGRMMPPEEIAANMKKNGQPHPKEWVRGQDKLVSAVQAAKGQIVKNPRQYLYNIARHIIERGGGVKPEVLKDLQKASQYIDPLKIKVPGEFLALGIDRLGSGPIGAMQSLVEEGYGIELIGTARGERYLKFSKEGEPFSYQFDFSENWTPGEGVRIADVDPHTQEVLSMDYQYGVTMNQLLSSMSREHRDLDVLNWPAEMSDEMRGRFLTSRSNDWQKATRHGMDQTYVGYSNFFQKDDSGRTSNDVTGIAERHVLLPNQYLAMNSPP